MVDVAGNPGAGDLQTGAGSKDAVSAGRCPVIWLLVEGHMVVGRRSQLIRHRHFIRTSNRYRSPPEIPIFGATFHGSEAVTSGKSVTLQNRSSRSAVLTRRCHFPEAGVPPCDHKD